MTAIYTVNLKYFIVVIEMISMRATQQELKDGDANEAVTKGKDGVQKTMRPLSECDEI